MATTMNHLQFIVTHLKEEPFNKSFRAVDFDELSPDEHLQILNDVLSSLSSDLKVDVRHAQKDQMVENMIQFLLIHKCKDVTLSNEDERYELAANLKMGEKNVVYSILQWALSNYQHLSKRSYLANFLMPVEVPSAYLEESNSNFAELLSSYKELQAEFIDVHKMYESTQSNVNRPLSDIRKDIGQLTVEKQQLLERLEIEKKQTGNNINFQHILEETSKLRQSQDNESRLEEQKKEQMQSKAAAYQRLEQVRHIFSVFDSMSKEETPIDIILDQFEREVQKSTENLEHSTMQQRYKLELKLLRAEREFVSSIKSEDDIGFLEETAAQMEDELQSKQAQLDSLCRHNKSDSKLSIFKQHAKIATSKLKTQQDHAEEKTMEKELLFTMNQKLRDAIANIEDSNEEIQAPDGTTLKKHELKDFRANLEKQTKLYNDSKKDLDEKRKETSVLKRTEQLLKSRHHNLDEFLRKEEDRAGVSGFRDAHDKLEHTSKQTATLNELKSQTLEEISKTVQKIAVTLESKKRDLEPKVKELKQARKNMQELQQRHQSKKARYDKLANKLMNDNKHLENECERLQSKWVEKERSYHLLCATDEIISSKLKCLSMEEEWRKGAETFLPDFRSLKDLYESKIVQQQGLAKELRKQQFEMRKVEEFSANQKKMFFNLKKLQDLVHLHSQKEQGHEENPIGDYVLTF